MTKKETTAVETVKSTAVATINFEEDANLGHEEITIMDKKIPYINLLQTNSPMVDEDDPSYIDGAKAGSIFITDSKTIVNGEIEIFCKLFVSVIIEVYISIAISSVILKS